MARMEFLAALVIFSMGCGGSDPCAGSRCPNESRPSSEQYQRCVQDHNAARDNKCNSQVLNYELCVKNSEVCASNGKIDGSATVSRINSDCRLALEAVVCCTIGFSSCK